MKFTTHCFSVIALFCASILHGQLEIKPIEQVRDSILNEISNTSTDTSKLRLICTLVAISSEEEMPEIYEQGLEIVSKMTDDKWKRRLLLAKGEFLINIGHTEKAFEHYNQLLKEAKETNNARLAGRVLMELSMMYQLNGDMDAALNTIQRSQVIFDSLGMDDQSASAHYNLSIIFRKTGKPDLALKSLETALTLITPEENPNLYLSIYNNLGRINRGLARYDTAQFYYQTALDFALETKETKSISRLYNNLGNIAHTKGKLEDALAYYFESLKIKEAEGRKQGISVAYLNMGAVKIDLKLYSEAKIDLEKSLALAEETDYKIVIVHNFLKLGAVVRELGDLEQAIAYHKQALSLSDEMDFKSGSCESYFYLGEDYQKKKSYSEALNSFLESKKIAEEIGKKAFVGSSLTEIANTYLLNSESSNPEFQNLFTANNNINIEEYLLESAQIAEEIGNLKNIEISLSALRNYYKKNKQFKKESEIANAYIVFRDSLFNKQSAEAISQWQTKYETSEKEKEIVILQKENELQEIKTKTNRNIFIGGSLFLMLISGLIYTRLFYKNKVERAKQVENLRNKISADLHDDVGSLLTGLAMQTEILQLTSPQTDQSKLSRISELSRSAMSRMRDAVWAMNAENDNWDSLIDRMNEFASEMLLTKDIQFTINKEKLNGEQNISGDFRQNIYLIFKEAITNILKHSSADQVIISLSNSNPRFEMLIKDNGVLKGKKYKTTGQGTNNMQNRAKKINGQLSTSYENGFCIALECPFLKP